MPSSYAQYTANGATTQFAVPFSFISRSHVTVKVDGVSNAFTWINNSLVQTSGTPANGAVVEVRRTTPNTTAVVDFTDASTLTETDLDNAVTQFLYLSQEAEDDVQSALIVASDGTYDAGSRRIKNVANPVNAQDAMTKNYMEATYLPSITAAQNAAASSASAAATSATNAASSASAASTSATSAASSASAAATSATNAASSASAASTSATNAATSATAAASSATAAATSAANIMGGVTGTSTTSLSVGLGSKTFTTQTSKAFVVGMSVNVARTSDPANQLMVGTVTAYDPSTGSMTVSVTSSVGSGTYTDWTVSLGGAPAAGGLSDGGRKVASFTASSNVRYQVAWGSTGTVTLPASPAQGDVVELALLASTSAYTTSINPNGKKINGATATLQLGYIVATLKITYDATLGDWT